MRPVPLHPGLQVCGGALGPVFAGAGRGLHLRRRQAAPQHLTAVPFGPRGVGVRLVPEAFGLRPAVAPLFPVTLPQDGAVGRQGERRQRGGAPPTQTAREAAEGGGLVLAHKLVVKLQEILVDFPRRVGDGARQSGVEGEVPCESALAVGCSGGQRRKGLGGLVGVLGVQHLHQHNGSLCRRGHGGG